MSAAEQAEAQAARDAAHTARAELRTEALDAVRAEHQRIDAAVTAALTESGYPLPADSLIEVMPLLVRLIVLQRPIDLLAAPDRAVPPCKARALIKHRGPQET